MPHSKKKMYQINGLNPKLNNINSNLKEEGTEEQRKKKPLRWVS